MTIGKLPATGPSPSPTENQEAPDNNRAGFQQAKPATDRVPPKPFQPKSGASPKPSPAPSGRTGAPDAPPAGTGGSAKTFWAQQDAASAKKPASRPPQNSPKTGAAPADASPPRPSRLRSASRPRRHRNPPTRPPAAPRRPGTSGTSKDTSRRQADAVDATASPIHWQARSGAVEADGPLRASNAERKRACPHARRATTRAGSRTDSVSERPGGLELEQGGAPVQRVCFDHYRTAHQIAVQETTELYLNGVNLTRDALQELQKLPIELLSLNSASGLQPHDEPIVLPRSLRALAIIGDALPTKALLAEADGIRDCCRYGHGAPTRTTRTPSHWHNPPPSRPSILHRTA